MCPFCVVLTIVLSRNIYYIYIDFTCSSYLAKRVSNFAPCALTCVVWCLNASWPVEGWLGQGSRGTITSTAPSLHHSHLLTNLLDGNYCQVHCYGQYVIYIFSFFWGEYETLDLQWQGATSEILMVKWSRSTREPCHGNLATAHIYQYTIVIFQYKQKYYFLIYLTF